MGKVHNGGYKAATGFKRESAEPLTDDEVWEFVNDLKTIPNAYEGMPVYVIETQLMYYFQGGIQTDLNNWIPLGNQVPEPTQEGTWLRKYLEGVFSWVSVSDWLTSLKNNLYFWKSDAFLGTTNSIVTVDETGQMNRGAEIITDNAYVDDLDLITPSINATYNEVNGYTTVVTPTNGKTFEAGRFFVEGNYKYEALANDNTITRTPLKSVIPKVLLLTATTSASIQSDHLINVQIINVVKGGVAYIILDSQATQTATDVVFDSSTGTLTFSQSLNSERIQVIYNKQ